jgi:hypothetical protein
MGLKNYIRNRQSKAFPPTGLGSSESVKVKGDENFLRISK